MLLEKNKKVPLFVMIILILLILAGGGNRTPEVSDIEITQQDREVYSFDKKETADTERIAEILNDIYKEAVSTPSGHSSMPYGNEDGTVTLHVNAVYPGGNMSKEFSHTTVIRPFSEGSFQYVSNEIILPEGDHDIWWHSNRLTEEERETLFPKEVYGGA